MLDRISRLEYFAANAPEAIPEWFKCNLPPEPTTTLDISIIDRHNNYLYGLGGLSGIQREQDLTYIQDNLDEYKSYSDKRISWENECGKIRYFEWRYYYAAQMLRTLSNRPMIGDFSYNQRLEE